MIFSTIMIITMMITKVSGQIICTIMMTTKFSKTKPIQTSLPLTTMSQETNTYMIFSTIMTITMMITKVSGQIICTIMMTTKFSKTKPIISY